MSIEWVLIRGSGVAAFALLSAATIWGLLVSSKLLGRIVKAKPLTWFHESLGIGALLATVVHVMVLSIHDFLEFSWIEILVPGVSDWRPLPTAFGVVSLYALIVVIGSFYLKRFIGQKVWRSIHFISFGLFVSALLHGLLSGTDSGSPLILGLYAGSALVVLTLLAIRLTPDTPTTGRTESQRVTV
ncbi:MAG: hypothetical protein WD473_03010 [Acidimicrobiia bacterium]